MVRLYRILDLFSGAGGFSLGFELFKDKNGNKIFETFMAVDNDKLSCQTFIKNFSNSIVIEGDITKKSIHREIIEKCRGQVDIIIGGPPCQSFSTIGPRSGYGVKNRKFRNDKRNTLYKEFVKIVREIKPKFVVIENVKGITSKRDRNGVPYINKLIHSLEKLGYFFEINSHDRKYQILNSVNFGVPQRRQRVFIIGNSLRIKNPLIKKTHFDPEKEYPEAGLKKGITLKEAIGDLPSLRAKITFTGLGASEIDRIRKLNENAYSGEDGIEYNAGCQRNEFLRFVSSGSLTGKPPEILRDHIARSHQITDIELFGLMKPGETAMDFLNNGYSVRQKKLIKYDMSSFFDKYRKQKWNAPSSTIFAHLEKDGNRFIHPDSKQARTFTVREAARIQSFTDDFVFEGPYNKKYKQIGNAVPPLLALAVAKNIHKCLG